MWYGVLIGVHLFVCMILVAAVLLQSGKGAEMGAAFGGSSQTLFGGRGAATFLSKMTVIAAIFFMLTSLGLSVLSRERSIASSIMDLTPEAPSEETAAPETSAPPAETPPAPKPSGGE